jgi:hypothetical protein
MEDYKKMREQYDRIKAEQQEKDEAAAYERGRLAGIEEGRAAERADVVAWLRHGVDVLGWHDEYLCAADDIEERGEHVGAAGGKK